ncbi:MAG: endonuclease/exonuclease/phosphatase family protein [Blastocatellia bacterium]
MRNLLFLLLCLSFCLAAAGPFVTRAQTSVAISAVQGNGDRSPLAGQRVTVTGIVTGVRAGAGFFLQTPDNAIDADPNTSEGIFVFTGATGISGAVTGNLLQVTGNVTEFSPTADPTSPPLTELTTASANVLSNGNPLPAPITMTAADFDTAGGQTTLERYEGMRVHVASLTAISPSDGSVNETSATGTSNGIFHAVLTGLPRPWREPGLEPVGAQVTGLPCCVPRFDGNPERLRINSAGIGAPVLTVTSNTAVSNVTGPLDFFSRSWTIHIDPPAVSPAPAISGGMQAVPVMAPGVGEFTVAAYNLERFFDTVNDPGIGEPVLTQVAFDNRLRKASLAIRNVLGAPDILGVVEMENLTTLQTLAARINSDAVAAGGVAPGYQAFLQSGRDPGGINVGFLVKSSRVTVVDVTQAGFDAMYTDPRSGAQAILNDRPPLVMRGRVQGPAGALPLTLIINHLRSFISISDPVEGARVRAKRLAQAEFLANLIQARQAANPGERMIVMGDFNAFEFNDGYVDVMGTVRGAPVTADKVILAGPDLVNPDLINMVETLPVDRRYSYVFDGNTQTIDHMLVTGNLYTRVRRFEYAHGNADFPETFRNDAARPERVSDHDAPVLTLSFDGAAATVSAASYSDARMAPDSIAALFGGGLAAASASAETAPLPQTLAGTSVAVRDSAGAERGAGLFFVSPGQINFLVPAGTANGPSVVTVTGADGARSVSAINVDSIAPGMFSANADGAGPALGYVIRTKPDGAQSYEALTQYDAALGRALTVPIDPGPEGDTLYLVLFGTGWRNRNEQGALTATIGGEFANVVFAGLQPGFAGLDQMNVEIPRALAGRGEVAVRVVVEGREANQVMIRMK